MLTSKDVIAAGRKVFKEMWDEHQRWIESNGKVGMRYLKPDDLKKKLNYTDKELLMYFVNQGNKIDDLEEYLASHP